MREGGALGSHRAPGGPRGSMEVSRGLHERSHALGSLPPTQTLTGATTLISLTFGVWSKLLFKKKKKILVLKLKNL